MASRKLHWQRTKSTIYFNVGAGLVPAWFGRPQGTPLQFPHRVLSLAPCRFSLSATRGRAAERVKDAPCHELLRTQISLPPVAVDRKAVKHNSPGLSASATLGRSAPKKSGPQRGQTCRTIYTIVSLLMPKKLEFIYLSI